MAQEDEVFSQAVMVVTCVILSGYFILSFSAFWRYCIGLLRKRRRTNQSSNTGSGDDQLFSRGPNCGSQGEHPRCRLRQLPSSDSIGQLPVKENVDIESKARILAVERELSYVRLLLFIFMHVGAVLLVIFVYFRTINGLFNVSEHRPRLSDTHSLVCWVMILALLVWVAPGQLTFRRMHAMHFLAMARMVWRVVTVPHALMLVFSSHGTVTNRIFLGVALGHGNMPLTLVWNMVYCCVSSWTYIKMTHGDTSFDDHFGHGHEIWYVLDELFATLVIASICYAMQNRTLAEARATVLGKVSAHGEETVLTLLRALCDAVVRLGPDLQVQAGSLQLGHFLKQKMPTPQEFTNTSFEDFLEESDRARFKDHVKSCSDGSEDYLGPPPAASLHVHMRDSNGASVSVQLFTAFIMDIDEYRGHLLGIREIAREQKYDPDQDAEGENSGEELSPRLEKPPNSFGPGLSTSSVSLSLESTTSQDLLPLANMQGEGPVEVALWFNAITWEIEKVTPALTGICGPVTVGANFLTWIVEHEAVKREFQAHVNKVLFHEAPPELEFKRLKLRPPFAKLARLTYTTRCVLSFSADTCNDGASDIDGMVVQASLFDFTQSTTKNRWKRSMPQSPNNGRRRGMRNGKSLISL